MLLVLGNHTYIYTQFDAQNARNSVLKLPDFSFFWGRGGMPPDPPSERGLAALVNTITYSSQTGCPLQTLFKPLPFRRIEHLWLFKWISGQCVWEQV